MHHTFRDQTTSSESDLVRKGDRARSRRAGDRLEEMRMKRVDEDGQPQAVRFAKEHVETAIVQRHPVHVGTDFDASQAQPHDFLEEFRGALRSL